MRKATLKNMKWGWIIFIALIILNFINCGPKRVSAFGELGDLCTEEKSCPPDTKCKLVGENYRCVKVTVVQKSTSTK